MGLVTFKHRGSFNHFQKFANSMLDRDYLNALDQFGKIGVEALSASTPVDSGETAQSWTYEIERTRDRTTISWLNTNTNEGANIALILQYGHGTGTGGYVQGRDYINPAMRPVFDKIAEMAWREVASS